MAASTTTLIIFTLILTFSATLSSGCGGCGTKPTPTPAPKPKPHPSPKAPPVNPFCPRDTLKLGACVDLLGGVVDLVVGAPPASSKCCAVLQGLADLEAAACLCTAIKANVLGINLNVPVTLSLLVSACEKNIPPGFKCV